MSFIKDLIVWKTRADRAGAASGPSSEAQDAGMTGDGEDGPDAGDHAIFDEDAFTEALSGKGVDAPPDGDQDADDWDEDWTDDGGEDWADNGGDDSAHEAGILDHPPEPARAPAAFAAAPGKAPAGAATAARKVPSAGAAAPRMSVGRMTPDASAPPPPAPAAAQTGKTPRVVPSPAPAAASDPVAAQATPAGSPGAARPAEPSGARPAAGDGGQCTDAGDVEAILARVAARNAARTAKPPVRSELRPAAVAAPPKIWELNVGPAQPAARREPPPVTEPLAAPARLAQEAAQVRAAAAVSAPPVVPVAPPVAPPPAPQAQSQVQAQPQPRPQAGRVKTRLLGFHSAASVAPDPFDAPAAAATGPVVFPTGWVVIVAGPGRGTCFTLQSGVSQIGRGEGQAIRLDFGDMAISRQNHAAIAYDDEMGRFYLGHGGKLNLVRLNDRPVLSTEELNSDDLIRIGETTLKFVAFCGRGFCWKEADQPAGRTSDAAAR